MDQPAEQKKPLKVALDRSSTSKAQKTLLAVLTARVMLVVTLLTLLQQQDAKLTGPRKASAVEIYQNIAPSAKTPAGISASSVRSPAEAAGEELFQKGMYALINRQFLKKRRTSAFKSPRFHKFVVM